MNDNDIDALLRYLNAGSTADICGDYNRYHAALRMLIAERDGLRAALANARRDRASSKSVLASVIAERDALKRRVEELEAYQPADRDRELRERLVCAIWPELLRIHSEYAKHPAVKGDPREQARRFALIEADEMLAAMRKGEA
jgi:chromosome condensin MukBEF ATPase and DNA-binding subunit MukB